MKVQEKIYILLRWYASFFLFLLEERRKKHYAKNSPYLETTSSKQVEYTKAFEITIIKELAN